MLPYGSSHCVSRRFALPALAGGGVSAVDRLEHMPDWPARMTAEPAAMYMGMSKGSFLSRYGNHGRKEGGNVYWARRQLDALIDAQFGIKHSPRTAKPEIDTWADL